MSQSYNIEYYSTMTNKYVFEMSYSCKHKFKTAITTLAC